MKQIDSTVYGNGKPGAMWEHLSDLFRQLVLMPEEGTAIAVG